MNGSLLLALLLLAGCESKQPVTVDWSICRCNQTIEGGQCDFVQEEK